MTVSLATNAVALPQGFMPDNDAGSAALLNVTRSLMTASQIETKLGTAMEGLKNPTAAGLLKVNTLNTELSVQVAIISSAIKSMSETSKDAIRNRL
ncbi:MAG: hypothetical protein H7332_10265 [Bdellovibrionales bacterium]|nr:hypothetical protein [Ramlibacter sp.]